MSLCKWLCHADLQLHPSNSQNAFHYRRAQSVAHLWLLSVCPHYLMVLLGMGGTSC